MIGAPGNGRGELLILWFPTGPTLMTATLLKCEDLQRRYRLFPPTTKLMTKIHMKIPKTEPTIWPMLP